MRRFCLLAALVVVVLGGCSKNPATGRHQLLLLSPQQAIAMGEQTMPQLVQEYGGEVPQVQLRAYIDSVGQRLLVHIEPQFANLPWQFITLNSDVINAFALPGGKIFVCRGLLNELENEAEVAAVLGHEIGHVTGRHVDERISQQLSLDFGVAVLGAATQSEIATAAGQLFANGYHLKFGRDQEIEADKLGLRYMVRAKYDPMAMLTLLDVLKESSKGNHQPEFLSTHPHPESRIQLVADQIAGRYSYTSNNPDFRLYTARFKAQASPFLGR
jgi:predicted Zn-dependent protease